MRTTLNIKDDLIERASKLTGIGEKTALVNLGLAMLAERKGEIKEAWRLYDLALDQFTRLRLMSEAEECRQLLGHLSRFVEQTEREGLLSS